MLLPLLLLLLVFVI